MKKKIVIDVPMHNDKAKSKAMKIAVAIPGVTSVSIGAENGWLEVTGEGVDSVCLANSLRKKFSFAHIVKVEDVKPAGSPSPGSSPSSSPPNQYYPPPPPPPPHWQPVYYESRVYDAPPPNCSIM